MRRLLTAAILSVTALMSSNAMAGSVDRWADWHTAHNCTIDPGCNGGDGTPPKMRFYGGGMSYGYGPRPYGGVDYGPQPNIVGYRVHVWFRQWFVRGHQGF